MSTANVDLANAIAAKKKEQEEGCSILASDVKFVPFIQMVSQTGKVEKQENGGMLVHSKFCDKVPKPRSDAGIHFVIRMFFHIDHFPF